MKGSGYHPCVENQGSHHGVCCTCEEGCDAQAKSHLGEHEHESEWPVGGLESELRLIGCFDACGDVATHVAGGWERDFRSWCTRQEVVFDTECGGVDFDD